MSPLWGFDVFVYPHCYKRVAPLGLWLLGHAARLETCRASGAKCTNKLVSVLAIHFPFDVFYNTLSSL